MDDAKLVQRFRCSMLMILTLILTGCGSGGPVELDAAGEQALREDMARVATEEQDQRRRSTVMTPAAPSDTATSFHPEERDQR